MQRTEWFKRKFPVLEDNGLLPAIIERLRGTPARLEEIFRHASPDLLTVKRGDKWSVQEEAGHLADIEPLWLGRVDDFLQQAIELRAADLTNQTTHNANHNATPPAVLLQRFREQRLQLVQRLAGLTDEQLLNTALHPRLKTPMRVIDHAYFVAEHDDHHLAGIREGLRP